MSPGDANRHYGGYKFKGCKASLSHLHNACPNLTHLKLRCLNYSQNNLCKPLEAS